MLQNEAFPNQLKRNEMTGDVIKKDDATTVKDLREIVRQFVEERDLSLIHI